MLVTPIDGMEIKEDTTFAPGVYVLPQGITVTADHITLDGQGAVLVGVGKARRGVMVNGRSGVTIQNLHLRDYYHGIYAAHCQGLTVQHCSVTGTAEIPANTHFLDIWKTAENAYGSGIFLWHVADSVISYNDLQHQMNGLLTYSCRRLTVKYNIANYCSGFGFHLHETCDSLFEGNYADFCCRYEPRGERMGHMGADAAGFLIVYGSCRNHFYRNNARLGGDGFFLAGLTPNGEHRGCDENLFEQNDGSYSPNIAFEATFSQGNVYRDNKANHNNYGFWLGFSRENVLEHNQIWRNRQAGIAVENGFGMQVQHNEFGANWHGILLWSKYVALFAQCVPENDTSRDWVIEHNKFIVNDKAIRIAANQDHGIRPLPPQTPSTPSPHHHTLRYNDIRDGRIGIELENVVETIMEENTLVGNVVDIEQR